MRANRERGEHGTENAGSCSGPNGDLISRPPDDGTRLSLAHEPPAVVRLVGAGGLDCLHVLRADGRGASEHVRAPYLLAPHPCTCSVTCPPFDPAGCRPF